RRDRRENSKSEIPKAKNKEATDETRTKHGNRSVFHPRFIQGLSDFDAVTVSEDFEHVTPKPEDGLWMMPLRTPLAATGFTERSLRLLSDHVRSAGLLAMQGGGASAAIHAQEKNVGL